MHLARPEFLVLFVLVAAYITVYLFARRYRAAKATYAVIWQRIAKARAPSRTREWLRRALTLLVSVAMLSALVLAVAQPEMRPVGRAPADFVLLVDTSPGTLRRASDGNRTLTHLADRAAEHLANLADGDRAWLLFTRRAQPVLLGPYTRANLQAARARLAALDPDFDQFAPGRFSREAYVKALEDLPPDPKREGGATLARSKHIVIVSDIDEGLAKLAWPSPWTVSQDLLGVSGDDAAFVSVTPAGPSLVRVVARGGAALEAVYAKDGKGASDKLSNAPGGGVHVSLDAPDDIVLTLKTSKPDPLPENNRIVLRAAPLKQPSIALVVDDDLSFAHLKPMADALAPPGVEVARRRTGNVLNDTIVITHDAPRAMLGPDVRAVLSFARLPEQLGTLSETGAAGSAFAPLEFPSWFTGQEERLPPTEYRFDTPMRLLAADGWSTVYADGEGRALVGARRVGGLAVLAVAASAFHCDVLATPDFPVLVRRWFGRATLPEAGSLLARPLATLGEPVALPGTGQWRVSVQSTALSKPREWLTDATGAPFGETWYPGEYTVTPLDKAEVVEPVRREVFWLADDRENLPGPVEARALVTWPVGGAVAAPPAWARDLPRLLLLIGAGLMLLEWVLYWLKVFD